MGRKLVAALVVVLAVVLSPVAAWADHCANFSRSAKNATADETARGRWFLVHIEGLGDVWVFDSPDGFMNGEGGGGLLDGAACPTGRLAGHLQGDEGEPDVNGVWTEECFEKAAAGLGS